MTTERPHTSPCERLPQQSLCSDALVLGVLVQLSAVSLLPLTQGVHGGITLTEDEKGARISPIWKARVISILPVSSVMITAPMTYCFSGNSLIQLKTNIGQPIFYVKFVLLGRIPTQRMIYCIFTYKF